MKGEEATGTITLLRPPDLAGVEVMSATHDQKLWRVFHETYAISSIFQLQRGDWRYRGRHYEMRGGKLSMMEPGEVHETLHIANPADFRVMLIDPELVQRTARDLGISTATPRLKIAQMSDSGLFRSFARLHASLQGASSTLERQSRFEACMRLFLARCTEIPPRATFAGWERDGLARARDFIHDHAAEEISLAALATAAGLSRFHFLRTFSARFGLPPHEYQIQLRISRACRLLAAGEPTAQVATDVGFTDQSHLARHFRRILALTPGQYVKGDGSASGNRSQGPARGNSLGGQQQ